ncbi:phage tail protein [Virgisporangium ochraceum]|uniref:Tail Collar domain-containing protein n=1 Tax=Virgisporangium ochraceum TaxID=65505 RepID=A0A8J4A571_9ACTN|nr:tail fiber protein [Virgisporangium ochraceum]GIJ74767.1 tail Collar domain-containing protein [Virgisporangium ochraceum]
MSEPFIGEIRIVGWNFAPSQWAFCHGQLMNIQQNTALFALLGVTYGGNGTTTFGLPDLRGRAPVHQGTGAGLTPRTLGEQGGVEAVTLIGTELPTHTHQARASTVDGTLDSPSGAYWAPWSDTPYVGGPVARVPMNQAAVVPAGSGQPHENRSPYLALNFVIALSGIFPTTS